MDVRLMHMRRALLAASLFTQVISALGAHTQARLIFDSVGARPGDTVIAGIELKMEPGWHTYWRNPGQEGGLPTNVRWELPAGIAAGPIEWPLPEKFTLTNPAVGNQPASETINYVYADEVVLLVPLKLAKELKSGSVTLKADVSWLECATKGIPGDATIQADLTIGETEELSPERALVAQWQKKIPANGASVNAHAFWKGPASGTSRSLI